MSRGSPLVTVTMTAFEHESWIEQALDGVFQQRTSFEFEVIVGEDCSSDRTRQLLLERAAREGDDRLQLVLPDSNMGHAGNALYAEVLRRARGSYLAFLDGDDVWTDSAKLEKQIETLEADPSLAICFHQAVVLMPDGQFAEQPYTSTAHPYRSTGRELCADNFIPSCSAVVRTSALEHLPRDWVRAPFGDWLMYLCASRTGDIAFIPETMGIYRLHGRGAWSRLTRRQQLETTVSFLADASRWVPELAADLRAGRTRRLLQLARILQAEGEASASIGMLREVAVETEPSGGP